MVSLERMLQDVPYVTVPFHRACPRRLFAGQEEEAAARVQCGRLGRARARASGPAFRTRAVVIGAADLTGWAGGGCWLGLVVVGRGRRRRRGGAREGRAGWLRQSLKRVSEFFKDGRNGGGERDPCVLRVPGTLRCEPLHDRVRHMQGLVPWQVKGWLAATRPFLGETTKKQKHCPTF